MKSDIKDLSVQINQNREKCLIEREKMLAAVKKNTAWTRMMTE